MPPGWYLFLSSIVGLAVGGGSVGLRDVLLGVDLVVALDVAVAGQSDTPICLGVILAASL